MNRVSCPAVGKSHPGARYIKNEVGTCPSCGRRVAITVDGKVAPHWRA